MLQNIFKYADFDPNWCTNRPRNMFSGIVQHLHEIAIPLGRTLQVLEGIAMHVITVASRNLWLLLETTRDQSKPPSCESQSARIKPGCESQPHLPSRNLRLRVVTKT